VISMDISRKLNRLLIRAAAWFAALRSCKTFK